MAEDFCDKFCSLLFKSEPLAFGLSCVILGFIVMIVDACSYYFNDDPAKVSLFGLKYLDGKGKYKTLLKSFFLWSIGSGLVGYLMVRLEVVESSFTSSVTISIGWPFMFKALVAKKKAETKGERQD